MFTQTCPVPLCLLRSLRRKNRSLWLSSLRRLYRETHYCSYNQNCSKMLEACQLMSDLSYQTGGWLPHGDAVRPDILEKYLGGKKKKYIYVNFCFYWELTCVGFLSFTFLYPMRLLQPHLATLPISLEELGRNNFRNSQHPQTTVKTAICLAKLLEIFSATLVAKLRLEKGSADIKTADLFHP